VAEGVVEGVERTLAWDVEEQLFLGCGLRDLDAGGVVVGAPVERDLDAAAEAAGELAAVGERVCRGVLEGLFLGGRLGEGLLMVLSPFFLVVVRWRVGEGRRRRPPPSGGVA